jgi:predicted ATPase
LILPKFARKLIWVAPIRSKPKRTYDEYKVNSSPEGDHIPYLLSKIFRNTSLSKTFLDFLDKFGQESGLFETIKIKRFGRNIDAPFELDVVFNKMPMKISNVGYGVSQALPIIVELFLRSKGHWFAIQQPEVHLHPKAQAAFGDLIYKVAIDENKNFFVETHSDYLIDRFRLNYRSQRSELSIPSQVLFFERTDEGNRVYPIDIMENGNYSDDQPENFRDFFIHEELRILGV